MSVAPNLGVKESGSRTGLLPVSRRLFRRERDLERYLNLWRLALLGVFTGFWAVLRILKGPEAVPGNLVLKVLVGYFLAAVVFHGVLGWRGWQPWVPRWVVTADVVFIVGIHLAFLVGDAPLVVTNSQIAFLGYFVVIALVGVRANPALVRGMGIAAPVSYSAVVFLAIAWRNVDTSPPDPLLGSFRWEDQAVRVLVLAAVSHLATLAVTLGLVDRAAARQDPLTGVYNRRHLEESLARLVGRALKSNRPLAVLLLDLDGFKEFNDQYGHLAGDRALVEVAAALTNRLRVNDLVARYGGDEFVVVLPEATGEEARRVARELVEVGPHSLRFSVGIACLNEQCRTGSQLLDMADAALLRAKRAGGGIRVAADR